MDCIGQDPGLKWLATRDDGARLDHITRDPVLGSARTAATPWAAGRSSVDYRQHAVPPARQM